MEDRSGLLYRYEVDTHTHTQPFNNICFSKNFNNNCKQKYFDIFSSETCIQIFCFNNNNNKIAQFYHQSNI